LPFSLVKVQRKVSQGLKVIQYYTTKSWLFKNDHMKALANSLSDSDRERFYFDIKQVDLAIFLENYLKGIRLYVLKEQPDTLPQARKLFKR
jgi:alcohol-forming fatty acyl-CoA reductase